MILLAAALLLAQADADACAGTEAQVKAAEEIYAECWQHGVEALIDDRAERPGVKFNDADLLGMPVRVTVGNALTRDGVVEVRSRRSREERRLPRAEVLRAIEEVRSAV